MLLQEDASLSHSFSECATEPFGREGQSLLQSLEALAGGQRVDEHRPLLMWVLQRLQIVQKQQMGTPVDVEGGRGGEWGGAACPVLVCALYMQWLTKHSCVCRGHRQPKPNRDCS